MSRETFADVLEPLEPFREHYLYPRMRSEVLATKRQMGWQSAFLHAERIARAAADLFLEKRMT